MRDEQWWRALTSGYVTQWEAMHPQKVDALFYAHSLSESGSAPPPAVRLTSSCPAVGTTPAEEAATVLKWPKVVCKERRFKIFDLAVGALSGPSHSEVPVLQAVYSSMRGIIRMHNPSVIITVANVDAKIKDAFRMAADSAINHIAFVLLPRNSISKVLWMATLHPTSLPNWNRMRISGNIITQNRAKSLRRLLASLRNTYYVGDEVPISFNMDSRVDAATLNTVNSFDWPHGGKTLRQRIIQGGLIRTQQAGGQQLRPPRWLTPFSLSVCARRLVRKDVGREREEVSVAPSTVVHSTIQGSHAWLAATFPLRAEDGGYGGQSGGQRERLGPPPRRSVGKASTIVKGHRWWCGSAR
ncbi:Os12g0183900 [Oryza sativa Japonica Group]|uniref:Os12g0183900 protein n=1 Tax=Oryza sativa subsp. japonica TaxID=39947 RepID=A0A0P0Y7N4_ORYSJ|nr:Os12g0183900 [Oryza sativa Japonica Group]